MRQKMKQLMGILLSISLMLGLVPGMSLTAYADGTTYNPASTYTGFGKLITDDTEVTISATVYSIVETAKANNVNVRIYLQ